MVAEAKGLSRGKGKERRHVRMWCGVVWGGVAVESPGRGKGKV